MTEDIIAAMRAAAPPGLRSLSGAQEDALRALTRELAEAAPDAPGEYKRFSAARERSLPVPHDQLRERLEGRTVLVTGGTGCIGTVLLRLLARYSPARLVSVSRGLTRCYRPRDGVQYMSCDVAEGTALLGLVSRERPDVIFHLAAQRSPALAEEQVRRTCSSNVTGALNVIAAAVQSRAQLVMASTGKAVRPYSPEVYTATKRAAEQAAAGTASATGLLCSASRFTHVADNSIFGGLLEGWARAGEPVRLHAPGIMFYVQSALESAQLLLLAMLGAVPGEFRVNAISDLGWPVSLLDVALGALAEAGTGSPVYLSGYDPGYEEVPFPGLYDPATAPDFSPLLNAFEAPLASSDGVTDSFPVRTALTGRAQELYAWLGHACAHGSDGPARQVLAELSWELLECSTSMAPRDALARSAALAAQYETSMPAQHRQVLAAIRKAAQ